MINHISGTVSEISPTHIVIDCNGVGYFLHLSLQTYEQIKHEQRLKLLTHLAIKEDSHTLYGFAAEDERHLFRQLITVSGIGTNTARMILSNLNVKELYQAIMTGNVALLQSIKGVGPKSAQRILLELKDKLKHPEGTAPVSAGNNSPLEEALQALLALGFTKTNAEKALHKVSAQGQAAGVEELIKNCLKIL